MGNLNVVRSDGTIPEKVRARTYIRKEVAARNDCSVLAQKGRCMQQLLRIRKEGAARNDCSVSAKKGRRTQRLLRVRMRSS